GLPRPAGQLLKRAVRDLANIEAGEQQLPLLQEPHAEPIQPVLVLFDITVQLKRLQERMHGALMQLDSCADLRNLQLPRLFIEQVDDSKRSVKGLYNRHIAIDTYSSSIM